MNNMTDVWGCIRTHVICTYVCMYNFCTTFLFNMQTFRGTESLPNIDSLGCRVFAFAKRMISYETGNY